MKYFYKYKLNYIAGIFKAMDSYKIADLEKGIKIKNGKITTPVILLTLLQYMYCLLWFALILCTIYTSV